MRPYPIGNGTVSPRIPREVAALIDALQLEGSNNDALLGLDDDDWNRLLDFCDAAHLALAVSELDRTGFPEWVVRRLEKNVADHARRFGLVKEAYIEAGLALVRADADHVVLKAFAYVSDYVSGPGLQTQRDIEIYCPRAHLERAQSALIHIGYEQTEELDPGADHLPRLSRPGDWRWRSDAYDAEWPPRIALHFCFWNQGASLIEIPEVEHFWERRVPRRLGKMEFCALHPVDQLGYLALGIIRGVLLGDCVVHHVLELATFLHRHTRDVEFWSEWHALHSVDLRRIEALAFSLARSWFSCAVPEVVRVEIDRLPPGQQRWLRRFGGAPLEVMFRYNKDGRLLQLLLTRSRTARQSVLRSVMIPWRATGLNMSPVRIGNRRGLTTHTTNRLLLFAKYLGRTALVNAGANISFLFHGVSLWFSTRALTGQFWTWMALCFVLMSEPILRFL